MDQRGPDDDAKTPEPDPDATAAFDPGAGFDPFKEGEEAPNEDETVVEDATHVIPPSATTPATPVTTPAWAGRAGVPTPPDPRLRDSTQYLQTEPQQGRTWWTPALLGLLALGLVGVVVLVAWFMSRDNTPDPVATPTITTLPTTAAPTIAPTTAVPTATATPTVQLVQIPAGLVGMTQQEATAELDKIGLFYNFEFAKSAKPEGEVIDTKPEPGALVPAQSTVTLIISLGEDPEPTPTPTATPTP